MGLSGDLVEVDVWEVVLDVDYPEHRYADPPAPFFEVNGYLVWPHVVSPAQLTLLRTTSQRGRFFGDPEPGEELESTGTNSIWISYEPATDAPTEVDPPT